MRTVLAASLLLSPMLYVASAAAATPNTNVLGTQDHRVSTGITSPVILDSINIHVPPTQSLSKDTKVVLSMNVDEKGNAQNIHVIQSANPVLDARVVAAGSQSRFRPAKLDNQSVPMNIDLVVKIQ